MTITKVKGSWYAVYQCRIKLTKREQAIMEDLDKEQQQRRRTEMTRRGTTRLLEVVRSVEKRIEKK